eukprot:4781254-Prymnesium_polylepis.1
MLTDAIGARRKAAPPPGAPARRRDPLRRHTSTRRTAPDSRCDGKHATPHSHNAHMHCSDAALADCGVWPAHLSMCRMPRKQHA